MSAHASVPRKEGFAPNQFVISVRKEPVLVPAPAAPTEIRTGREVLGILGLLSVSAILGFAVYLVAVYLL